MTTIYISGPITGRNDYRERFAAAEAYVRRLYPDAAIINPADKSGDYYPQLTDGWGRARWTLHWISTIVNADLDFIAMLPSWDSSEDAQLERRIAHGIGVRFKQRLTEADLAPPSVRPAGVDVEPLGRKQRQGPEGPCGGAGVDERKQGMSDVMDRAVEAAAKVMVGIEYPARSWDDLDGWEKSLALRQAQLVVEAAAPFLRNEELWAEYDRIVREAHGE